MQSWEKQVLGSVNRVCDIKIDDEIYHDILITNIDLERNNIIGRKYKGEGQFITFLNVDNAIIMEHDNRRPGKNEWNRQECL
jgi:hypothetical protein